MEREFTPKIKKRLKIIWSIVLVLAIFDAIFIIKDHIDNKVEKEAIIEEYKISLAEILDQYEDIKRYAIFSDGVGIYIPIEKWNATLSSDREDFCEEIATWVIYSANNSDLWSVENRIILTFYDLDRNELKHYYLEDK